MAAITSTLRLAAAKAGNAARSGDPERITSTRRELAAARLAEYIARVVDDAPPLTTEQRDRLALLLRGGDAE